MRRTQGWSSARTAFKRRRCLIPADGFYEWKKEGKARRPFYIHFKRRRPIALVGPWEHWKGLEGEVESCAIVTCGENTLVKPIHDRMPVILPPPTCGLWRQIIVIC